MTVEELKAEAAKLPPDERLIFADWLATDEKIRQVRQERLRAEIQKGLAQIERGEFVVCKDDEELHEFFSSIRARGQERLAAEQRQTAA